MKLPAFSRVPFPSRWIAWEGPCLPACWSSAGREGQVGTCLVFQVCRWGEGQHWYPWVQKQRAEPRRLHLAVPFLLVQCKYLVFSFFSSSLESDCVQSAVLARFGWPWRQRQQQQLWQSSNTPFLHITLRSSSRLWDFRISDIQVYNQWS